MDNAKVWFIAEDLATALSDDEHAVLRLEVIEALQSAGLISEEDAGNLPHGKDESC